MKKVLLLALLCGACGPNWIVPEADDGGTIEDPSDASTPDVDVDSGTPDSGIPDAGTPDAGDPGDDDEDCRCGKPGHGQGRGHCYPKHRWHDHGHGNGHCKYDCED